MRALAVIPARYASVRFPGKPLALIAGKPLVQHVWERCRQAEAIERVIVATEDARTRDAGAAFGAEAELTSPDHAAGTDRVAEIA
ncbi:MAG: 3-deoxy-manno-octulosonate cytidylyltransferase, partial [bacterium]|nr:3-deoxy-manno-octulosonate cytidylyltransferase [bacterium]